MVSGTPSPPRVSLHCPVFLLACAVNYIHMAKKGLLKSEGCHLRVKIAAVAILALVVAGCGQKSADDDAPGSSSNMKAEVTLARVVRADISEAFALTGTAAALPNQDVRVSALVAGRIADLPVAEGDRVAAGQVIARLDDSPYSDQLKQAEAAEQQAKANLENAQLSFTRNQDLFQRGIAARKDLEDARTQQSVAEAALHQAEAALSLSLLQFGRALITSPLNGVVVKRFVSVGEQVDGTAAHPIVEVAALRELEFLGNAPAVDLARMHPGETVEVTSQSVPDRKFPGHIIAISPAVDPATGLGLVRIRVPNPGGLLRLGVFLSADVPIETHARALVVPPEAIYRNQAGQPRVFAVNGGTATAVPVQLGIQTKDRVELLAGVQEGETIIRTGGYGLPDTAAVQTQSQP